MLTTIFRVTLSSRVRYLEKQYGGLRAAATALGIDPAYLYRLKSGEKDNPSDAMLGKLGLVRRIFYIPIVRRG